MMSFILRPGWLPPRQRAGKPACDALCGPCACGDWHEDADMVSELHLALRTDTLDSLQVKVDAEYRKVAELYLLAANKAPSDPLTGTLRSHARDALRVCLAIVEARRKKAGT